MSGTRYSLVIVLFAIGGVGSGAARGQNQNAAKSQRGGMTNWAFVSADSVMNMYLKAMVKHYNLNEDQEEYTRQFMRARVKRFLSEHESELRSLLWEMGEFTAQKKLPPAEMAKEWAQRSTPLFEAARKAILDGNHEWRDVLDEKQRKTHDLDMKLMEVQFRLLEQRLKRWTDGNIKPSDLGLPSDGPRTANPEDAWRILVRRIINNYKLDAQQRNTAESILNEMLMRAREYREANSQKFAELGAKEKALQSRKSADPSQRAEAARLKERFNGLNRPIAVVMRAELEKRVMALPTKTQIDAFKKRLAERAKVIARIRKMRRKRGTTTRPASLPATRPGAPAAAETRPAGSGASAAKQAAPSGKSAPSPNALSPAARKGAAG